MDRNPSLDARTALQMGPAAPAGRRASAVGGGRGAGPRGSAPWPPIERHQLGPELGGEIRKARRRLGLSLRRAARLVGCSHATIVGLELGYRAPSQERAEDLVRTLAIPDEIAERIYAVADSVEAARHARLLARRSA